MKKVLLSIVFIIGIFSNGVSQSIPPNLQEFFEPDDCGLFDNSSTLQNKTNNCKDSSVLYNDLS